MIIYYFNDGWKPLMYVGRGTEVFNRKRCGSEWKSKYKYEIRIESDFLFGFDVIGGTILLLRDEELC